MATAEQERPMPNLEIYDFESDIEHGFSLAIEAHNKPKPAAQGDKKLLTTPRIEAKFVSGQQTQKSYRVPGTSWAYQHLWNGILYLKIVTNRLKPAQDKESHRLTRALVRWVMQDHINELSNRMKYISIVQSLETGTQPSFNQQDEEEISGMAYAVTLAIKESAFPIPT